MTYKEGYKFEDLSVGMTHQTEHVITEKDIELFAEVSGDRNPLHMDEEFAKQTPFGQRIAQPRWAENAVAGVAVVIGKPQLQPVAGRVEHEHVLFAVHDLCDMSKRDEQALDRATRQIIARAVRPCERDAAPLRIVAP